MKTTKNTETLTAAEIEQLLRAIDKVVAENPQATTFEVAEFERRERAHILAWRGRE